MENSTKIFPGDIESYCLGLSTEAESRLIEDLAKDQIEIRRQIDDFSASIEQYALLQAVTPPAHLKSRILDSLSNLKTEEAKDINTLPLINKYTDFTNWLHIVQPLLANEQTSGLVVKILRADSTVTQLLMSTDVDYPDEVHDNEEECFIVLKGRCRCYVGNDSFVLGPGDFLQVPLHSHHSVEVIEPVTAVVQRKKVA
jgi:mannose-6-phosphate isomerase-like protein (cupin superfamily)